MQRNTIEIKTWMLRNGVRMVTIQRELGHKDNKTVWNTIHGRMHNRRVLAWLRAKGCPEKHLALPDDMRQAA
jgi:integrase